MALIANSNTLDTAFTPGAAGDFDVQVTGGMVNLLRRNVSGAAWAFVQGLGPNQAVVVANPVAGADYMFASISAGLWPSVAVRADQ